MEKTAINYILVYLLLFVSGSMLSMLSSNKSLVLVFLISLAAWFLFTDRKISDKFLLYITIFAGLLFSLSLYTGGSHSIGSVISGTMRFLLAYLIVRTVGTSFVDTYIKVVIYLALFSLWGYLTDILHLFDGMITKLPRVGEMGYEGIFYLYRHAFHPYRNASIFFEPGAYQGFLNAALFMIFFVKTEYGEMRRWIYILILIAALITTFSTTGFVIFLILFALFLYKSKILPFYGKVILIGALIGTIGIFATQFKSVFVDKLSAYISPEESLRGYSAHGRSYDLQIDLELAKENLFGLGFKKYREEFKARANSIGGGGKEWGSSSNGVSATFAQYGMPFALFIFVSYYWAFRKLLDDYLLASGAFVIFLLFLWGEAYYSISSISFSIIAAAFILDRSLLNDKTTHKTA